MEEQERHLKEAAFFFLKELLNVKSGERFLIYVDQGGDCYTAKIIQDSAQQIGVATELLELNSGLKFPDAAQELMYKIEKGAFDVICELSEQYFYQTPAWKKALQLGSRIYSLAGLNADAFSRCVGGANHKLMFQFGTALSRILGQAKSIQILTKNGTDIKFKMSVNPVFRFISRPKRKQKPRIFNPSGAPVQKGQSTYLTGQLAFRGFSETIEGKAVIDGYLWPPKEIGHIDAPIILEIKKGSVVRINGCPLKSKVLNSWFEGKTKEIQHFCIGFNPGATLSGKIMEAERVFGCISIGVGQYPFHTDGIIKNPSILSNDEIIERDGSFIQEELSILERQLLQEYQNKISKS